MRVLVACEFSGIVRDAFLSRGHYALSCDLIPSESDKGDHHQGDVRDLLDIGDWDLLIAHPPCTHLAVSGARWFNEKKLTQPNMSIFDEESNPSSDVQEAALNFVRVLLNCSIPRKCIENPVSVISSAIRKPDQIIQPYEFGHGETKRTCLWLENLPKLVCTNYVDGRVPRVHHEAPGSQRKKNRSRTYVGIAEAMADQWGQLQKDQVFFPPEKPSPKKYLSPDLSLFQ